MIVQVKPFEKQKHNNDCWNTALSLALNKDYDDVRILMEPFISPDGHLSGAFISGVLDHHGFDIVEFANSLSIIQVASIIDDKRNHVVYLTNDDHCTYSSNKAIYDFQKDVGYKTVSCIFIKPKGREDGNDEQASA